MSKEEAPDIVTQARERYELAKEAWGPIYDKARDDLRFLSDEPDAQWETSILQQRKDAGLNCITLDKTDQTVNQVVNNIKQNTPCINVIPDGQGGTSETAEDFKGIIKGIEYSSRADSAYDTAAENAVKARLGFIRVDHDYAYDEGFEQKLCIKRVINPLACYIDPASTEIDGSDAEWGFVIDTMKVGTFKKKYPGKNPISFDADKKKSGGDAKDDDDLMIAEYFVKSEETRDIALMADGSVKDFAEGLTYVAKRTVAKVSIKRYKLSGADELEGTSFPGKYVPIIPVYGKEAWEDGKRRLQSLISKVKPGARLHNLWASIETDILLKASRAPIVAPEGATEAHAKDYKNPDKTPVLRYTQYDSQGRTLDAPKRLDPFPVPTGVVNARRESVDDIKAAMGIYNASLGAQSNETSGVAIARRAAQGDTATFHFGDNLVKSIEHVGRILVFAAPEIYDTERELLSVDGEEKTSIVKVNGADVAEGQKRPIDLKKGRYTVRVTTGPNTSTRRQETFESLKEIFQGQPDLIKVFGDIFFRAGDFTGSQALADRAEKLLPPGLKDDGTNVDPEKQQLTAQVAQMEQALQVAQQQLQQKDDSLQTQKQLIESDIENKELKAVLDIERKQSALEKKEADLKMLEQRLVAMKNEMAEQLAVIENNARQSAQNPSAFPG